MSRHRTDKWKFYILFKWLCVFSICFVCFFRLGAVLVLPRNSKLRVAYSPSPVECLKVFVCCAVGGGVFCAVLMVDVAFLVCNAVPVRW